METNSLAFLNQFGDSQKLRLVRILRSTVMVRVGGGWVALDEFLQKNDPCRGKFTFCLSYSKHFYLVVLRTHTFSKFVGLHPCHTSVRVTYKSLIF